MPESAEQLFERLFGKPAKGGDASPSGETAEQLFGRLYGSAPTPAAVDAPGPADALGDAGKAFPYGSPKYGISAKEWEDAGRALSGTSNPDAWTGETHHVVPTEDQILARVDETRSKNDPAARALAIQQAWMKQRLEAEDAKWRAGQVHKSPLEIDREGVPLERMERELAAAEATRRERQMSPLAAVGLSGLSAVSDVGDSIVGLVAGQKPQRPEVLDEADEVVSRSGLGTKIAYGLGRATGQMGVTAPVAGVLGGGGLGWTAANAGMAALQAPEGERLQAAGEAAASMALTLGGMRVLQQYLPGNALVRIPLAGTVAGTGAEVVVDVATGREITPEQFAEKAARNLVFSLNDIPAARRAEVLGAAQQARAARTAEREAGRALTADADAAKTAAGLPVRPEIAQPAPTAPAAPTRGIGRARKPARTMTEQEAGQVKQTYLAKGGDPDKVLSPERVADAARGEKPKDRVVGKRIVKGYVPSTDPVGDGLVEQGAEAAVEKAVELGVAPVSSGVDAKTGEGYVVGQAESGKVVEVRAAPQPDVAAPRLPEKAPTITREQAARANTAREALRAAINNPDLVGRQRADTIENLRNLTVFLDRTASKNLKSGVEFGDPVAYTGEDAPPGMRHFIYLEGAKAGRYGVAPTPEARAESVAKSKTEWREQQADFRKLREPTPAPDVAAPRPPGKAAGGDTAPRADVPVKVNRGAAYLREIRDADKARAARPPPKRDVVTPADDAVIGKNAAGELLYERADGSRYRINPRNRPGRQADFGGDLAPVEPDAPSGDFDIDPATGLPNYLSHVKPSKPLKPGPMRRMDNPERGTVDIGPAIDTAKEVGGLGTGGAKWVAKTARAWLGKASDSVRGLGGDGAGDALADDLAKSRQLASDYEAEHTDRLVRVRRGFSKGSVARAAQMPAAETADGASLRGREIIEGRLAPNADEAGVYGEYGGLLADTWNHQDRLGLTRGRPIPKAERDAMKAAEQAAAEAEDRPVRPTPKTRDVPMGQIKGLGKTLPDAPNQLLRHIYKKGGEWFETLVRATQQKHADADPAEVREYLEGKREEFNRVGALNPEGHMASEFVREYGLPDFLRIDGELVPIQETSMFKRATSLVSGGANVVGQRLVFGSGNKSTVAERRKAFEATGDEVAFDRAMRSGYGISPFHSMRGLPPTPSSVKGLVGLTKGLALTASPIYNTTDTVVGNPSKVTGIVRGLRGVGDAFLNLMHRAAGLGETKRMRDLEAKGFRNRNVIEWALDPHAGKAWGAITGQKRLSRAAGVVGELAGGLGRAIKQPFSDAWNQFQEDAAASSLERWTIRQAKDVIGKVSGGSREYHVEAFQEVGLSRKDAEALVDGATSGKMTPDELATTLHRLGVEAVSATTASNIRPSATSLAEHLPGFRLIWMFPRFAMANVRFSGRSLMASMDGWSKALKDPSLTRGQRAEIATAANARFAEFLVRAAVQGAAFKLFASGVKSLFGNDDGEIEKMMDDPEAYAAKAIADATTGGPVSQGIMAVDRGSVYLGGTVPGRALDTWRVVWNGVTLDLTEAKAMLEKASPLYKSITGGENTKEQRAIEREEARDDEPAKGVGGSYRRSRGHSSTFRGR